MFICFRIWGYLLGWVYHCHWQIPWHQEIWRCHQDLCTAWHFLEQNVVDLNCISMGKGTDHVVNFHVCTGAYLEQVLPSRNHHPEIPSGSVPLCHPPLLLLSWLSCEPVCCPQVSGFPFWKLMGNHHVLCRSISSALHVGNWETGEFLEWQVRKIIFCVET